MAKGTRLLTGKSIKAIVGAKSNMGRKQSDIDRIAELEQKVNDHEHCIRHVAFILNMNSTGQLPTESDFRKTISKMAAKQEAEAKEIIELRGFMRKVKEWVKQLPIEARVDMPELQQ